MKVSKTTEFSLFYFKREIKKDSQSKDVPQEQSLENADYKFWMMTIITIIVAATIAIFRISPDFLGVIEMLFDIWRYYLDS